ncbi:MAG: LysM domain-containing protein [Acidobacteriota bacterium]|nr:LysM domain-containing protein [Acidobacteriota bacterium]
MSRSGSSSTLYNANGLTEDSMLSLGQVLRIPR